MLRDVSERFFLERKYFVVVSQPSLDVQAARVEGDA
jgi:hypothetical protein